MNVLATTDQALAVRFAGAEAPELRFEMGDWVTAVTGAPLLATAVAGFDCRVVTVLETGTHTVFIGEVLEARLPTAREPLLYLAGAYGRFAGRA